MPPTPATATPMPNWAGVSPTIRVKNIAQHVNQAPLPMHSTSVAR
jgi:hypothetical protein